MLKVIKLFFLLFVLILIFNKQLISYYFSYKFSKWTERELVFDKFDIDYPNKIEISGIKLKNSKNLFYDNIFESDKVTIVFELNSLFFSNLIIVQSLTIESPRFFLDIFENNKTKIDNTNSSKIFEDNIGLAKKINENSPDKIWPEKRRDINFLILKAKITGAKAFIKVSTLLMPSEVKLSNMQFIKIGNEKNYQHYKDVLRIILFDIMASTTEPELKKILKIIYKY
tara:strand:+ start:905 stop:1585 length:681 start_codon:yes stop_codon:yes gene_type:complete